MVLWIYVHMAERRMGGGEAADQYSSPKEMLTEWGCTGQD